MDKRTFVGSIEITAHSLSPATSPHVYVHILKHHIPPLPSIFMFYQAIDQTKPRNGGSVPCHHPPQTDRVHTHSIFSLRRALCRFLWSVSPQQMQRLNHLSKAIASKKEAISSTLDFPQPFSLDNLHSSEIAWLFLSKRPGFP